MKRELSLNEAEQCVDLMEQCAEHWLDPSAWQTHLVEGVKQLIGGHVGVFAISRIDKGAPAVVDASITRTDPAVMQMFSDYLDNGGLRLLPEARLIAPLLQQAAHLTYVQSELVPRQDYFRSEFYQRFMRTHRIEEALSSITLNDEGLAVGLSVSRCRGDRPFSARDASIMSLLTRLFARRIGHALTTSEQISISALAPRLQATLSALIQGDSEKLIAKRLCISPATAHEYVRAVYGHFGVRSRAMLMAYLLRRKPGGLSR